MINNQNVAVISEKVAYLETLFKESTSASGISYVNTSSGLTADDVQEAIDELNTNIASLIPVKIPFTPNYGTSEALASRNFFVTDNLTFIEAHFCIKAEEAIAHDADLINLPDVAKNKIPQYGFGIETSNNKSHIVYNSDNYIYLDAVNITADADGVFAGMIKISLI